MITCSQADEIHFTKRAAFRQTASGLIGSPEGRLNPADMITRMIELVPATEGKFRNVFPEFYRRPTENPPDRNV